MTNRKLFWETIKGMVVVGVSFYAALKALDFAGTSGITVDPFVRSLFLLAVLWASATLGTKNIRAYVQDLRRRRMEEYRQKHPTAAPPDGH